MKLTTSDEDKRNLINNRQNGRRRGRGSGAPRPNGQNNGQGGGNRIDSRARGNASQLHEKYKTLARDAQMQGDRVLTEYYLQFADHYFRVLSESRARFDEQRRPQGQDDYEDNDGDGAQGASGDDRDDVDGFDQPRYEQQPRRDYRPDQQQRDPQRSQPRQDVRPEPRQEYRPEARQDTRPEPRQDVRPEPREEREARASREDRAPRDVRETPEPREAYAERRPRGRPRRDAGDGASSAREVEPEPRIEMDRLPPALSVSLTSNDEVPTEGTPRRRPGRPRRVRPEEGGEATVRPDAG